MHLNDSTMNVFHDYSAEQLLNRYSKGWIPEVNVAGITGSIAFVITPQGVLEYKETNSIKQALNFITDATHNRGQ